MKQILLAFTLIGASLAHAKFYKYTEIQIKDQDEIKKLINSKIQQSRSLAVERQKDDEESDDSDDSAAIEPLREASEMVLSRPNHGNLLSELMAPLRRELGQYDAFEETITSIVADALIGVNNQKLAPVYRATLLFVLLNAMSEMKPDVPKKLEFRKAFEKIRDAKIVIAPDVRRELKMTSMYELGSPSDVAKKVLQSIPAAKPSPAPSSMPDIPSEDPDRAKKIIEVN